MFDWLKDLLDLIFVVLRKPEGPLDEEPIEEPGTTTPIPPATEPDSPSPEGEEDTQPPDAAFIWKPISDGDRKLAIITPYQYEFQNVFVEWKAGKKKGIEEGRYIGRGNGHRQAWRFSKRGRAYGKNVRVICLSDMNKPKEWLIPDGAKRFESRDYTK